MYRLDSPAFVYPGRYSPYPAGAAAGPRFLKITSATDPSKTLDVNVDELFQEMLGNYGSTPVMACQTWILIDHARNTNYLSSAIQRKYQVTWPTPTDLRPLLEWFDQQCNNQTAPVPTPAPPGAPSNDPGRNASSSGSSLGPGPGTTFMKITSGTDPSKTVNVNLDDLFQQMSNVFFSTEMTPCQVWFRNRSEQKLGFLAAAIQQTYQAAWITSADVQPIAQWIDQKCSSQPSPNPMPGTPPKVPPPTPTPNPMPVPVPGPPTPPTTPSAATAPGFWNDAKVPAMVLGGVIVLYWLSKRSK